MKLNNKEFGLKQNVNTNNELIQVVNDLGTLNIWSMVRFIVHVYEKKLVRRGEPTLYAPLVPRRRLVVPKRR